MIEYRFSLGDAEKKGLGLCFSILAESRLEAAILAIRALARGLDGVECAVSDDVPGARVYVNPIWVTADRIIEEWDLSSDGHVL